MDFNLTKEQQEFQKKMSTFSKTHIESIAMEIDDQERFPTETIEKMIVEKMMGIPYPKTLKGLGLDTMSYVLAIEELSKVCASTGNILSTHTSLACHPIFKYGNVHQKEKYLKPMNAGEMLGAFALTETNAGTDALSQETVARLEGDNYIINGEKMFITNAGHADIYIVFAMTDKEKRSKGISAFIVEKDFKGFSVGEKLKKMGIRGSATAKLYFNDCIVPKENLLGEVGQGFSIAMNTLDGGRIGIAAQAIGIAQGAFDHAVKYMKERKQFNKPLADFQGLQWMIADMAVKIEAAKLLTYKAACAKDQNEPYSAQAAMAKLYASETAMSVTTLAVQIFGGIGYLRGMPIERMMRDAKITEIYEGTSQVQKMVIARDIINN